MPTLLYVARVAVLARTNYATPCEVALLNLKTPNMIAKNLQNFYSSSVLSTPSQSISGPPATITVVSVHYALTVVI